MIPYGRHRVSESDIAAILEVLRSEFLTQGPVVPRFEEALRHYTGASQAVATNSATAALHVACRALGLGPQGRLWTSPITFVASANCARYCDADVDFVDIDPDTWNLSVLALKQKLVTARHEKRLPDILVAVHFSGQPTEQEEIKALGEEFGFRIVEDASHSLGATRRGERVGSCRWSDVTVLSFHPVKIITSGEGGMALTNDEELAWQMRLLRNHGITREAKAMRRTDPAVYEYEQIALGWNYRQTDIHAALGLSQLRQLDSFVDRRNEIASRYSQRLADAPLQLPTVRPENRSAFHLYIVRLRNSQITQREAIQRLRDAGIGATLHYPPVHLQPYYRDLGFGPGAFPEAEQFGQTALTLPLYPDLKEDDQEHIVQVVGDLLSSRVNPAG